MRDAHALLDDVVDPNSLVETAEKVCKEPEKLVAAVRQGRKLIEACPENDGAKVLGELLEAFDEQRVIAPGFDEDGAAIRRDLQSRA